MSLPFDYTKAYYRRNNFGQPCVWYAKTTDNGLIAIYHGILGKTITYDLVDTNRALDAEITSRVNAKRKTGYKLLSEVKDNATLPVEGELIQYLTKYLPDARTTADGTLLPMLAKVYDRKVFNKCSGFIGQWKINGLRCFISAEANNYDMFKPIKLIFQSREGTYWKSLSNLEDYLLSVLDKRLISKMLDEHYILDGELYIPGASINEINHAVKDSACAKNKLIQYWCYDIAIDDITQANRLDILRRLAVYNIGDFRTSDKHYTNTNRFVVLPTYDICNDSTAIEHRDKFINAGFEGLILRNPTAEYQYGKRNSSMIKFKRSTDGKFTIIDIYPEGVKRSNIPLLLCRNDINDATFEVHLSANFDFQENVLRNKEKYIGKEVFITYGERSGIQAVPFHVKDVTLI